MVGNQNQNWRAQKSYWPFSK